MKKENKSEELEYEIVAMKKNMKNNKVYLKNVKKSLRSLKLNTRF